MQEPSLEQQIEFVEQELVSRALLLHKIKNHPNVDLSHLRKHIELTRAVWKTLLSLKGGNLEYH